MNQNQDHSELVNKILTGARWATMLRLSAQIFSWLSTIIVVRFISPEDYGLNAMLESPMILMMLFSTLGLSEALVQAKNIKNSALQSIFGWLLLLNGILFLSYFFGGVLLAAYFNDPRLELLAKALAFLFIFVPFRVIPNALLDRQLNFKLRAQLELVATVVASTLTLILAYMGLGVWALVMGVIINKALLTILLMMFKPWFILPRLNFAATYQVMTAGGIIMLASTFTLLSSMLGTLIAGPILGPALLGIYAVAGQFALLPLSKGMPIINQTILPAFSKFQEHPDVATYYMERFLGVIALVFTPMLVGMACMADILVLTVFGSKWVQSIIPLTIMSLAVIFRMNTILLRTLMTSMGRTDLLLKSSFLQLVLLFPITIYAIKYGVNGLVAAWVTTEILISIATIQLSKQVFSTSFLALFICYRPALISSAIMGGSVIASKFLLSNQPNIIILLTPIIIGILSYYLSIRMMFPEALKTALTTILGQRFAFLMPHQKC